MKPFKLAPHYADYLWGGQRLKTLFGKQTDVVPLAESWELSCHPAGPSVAMTGENAGKTLSQIVQESDRGRILGTNSACYEGFPLLIKLIDAQKALSIQVHPDDAYAREHENSYGKTEMWYVLDAEPDSFVYYGVREQTTREELRAAIESNTLEEALERRPVKAGDVIFIPAGTLHAIGAGILVCEVQQNSNVTYRVYDFGRRGADGKLRELHVEKALDVATLTPSRRTFAPAGAPEHSGGLKTTRLVGADCGYFTADLLEVSARAQIPVGGESFYSLLCIDGTGMLECGGEKFAFCRGESVFIPADAGSVALDGNCRCVLSAAGKGPAHA